MLRLGGAESKHVSLREKGCLVGCSGLYRFFWKTHCLTYLTDAFFTADTMSSSKFAFSEKKIPPPAFVITE